MNASATYVIVTLSPNSRYPPSLCIPPTTEGHTETHGVAMNRTTWQRDRNPKWAVERPNRDTTTKQYRYNRLSNQLNNRLDNRLNVCLHDAAGCSTGFTTGFTTGWTTGYIVYTNIQPVVKTVEQAVVSCKRGLMTLYSHIGCQMLHLLYSLAYIESRMRSLV